MSQRVSKTTLAAWAALAAGTPALAAAADDPFALREVTPATVQLADAHEGGCGGKTEGEGRCGGKTEEGEGRCGGKTEGEGSCGGQAGGEEEA
ncbi:MAG: hypothetical protein KatS3mg124_1277 [Porticoccaceae bacterium]|nr:MAG: hypothetical protein KatS3mg124_1277 [Porticoccaceae bacterium]